MIQIWGCLHILSEIGSVLLYTVHILRDLSEGNNLHNYRARRQNRYEFLTRRYQSLIKVAGLPSARVEETCDKVGQSRYLDVFTHPG